MQALKATRESGARGHESHSSNARWSQTWRGSWRTTCTRFSWPRPGPRSAGPCGVATPSVALSPATPCLRQYRGRPPRASGHGAKPLPEPSSACVALRSAWTKRTPLPRSFGFNARWRVGWPRKTTRRARYGPAHAARACARRESTATTLVLPSVEFQVSNASNRTGSTAFTGFTSKTSYLKTKLTALEELLLQVRQRRHLRACVLRRLACPTPTASRDACK